MASVLAVLIAIAVAQVGTAAPMRSLGASGPKQQSPEDTERSARQAIERLTPRQDAFMSRRMLEVPPKKLSAEIKSQAKALGELVTAYSNVVQLGAPLQSVRALVRSGELYWHFADELLEYPSPVQGEDERIYRQQIEEQSQSIRDKAIDCWKAADRIALDHQLKVPELEAVRPRFAPPPASP